MLFYQGISAYEIWTGVKFTEDKLKSVYESFKNICSLNQPNNKKTKTVK